MRLSLSVLLTTILFAPALAQDGQPDPLTGLKMIGDWQLVRSQCIACHSAKLITQQRASRGQWLAMIRWMQKSQNLWAFEPDVEQRIIAYLAENYPPAADRRRAAIPPAQMPDNPYAPPSVDGEQPTPARN